MFADLRARFNYYLIRGLVFPLSFCSYKTINRWGSFIGILLYYLFPSYRKRALSNLANSNLALSNDEIESTAKGSIQNLIICFLEYAKLDRENDIHHLAHCSNPEEAQGIINQQTGVIFFCAHQANWEILFLEGTSRMPGVAIGRPTKNRYLYEWITSIREKFGGQMVTPQNGVKEGLRALKKGYFFGIVGDQALPESGFKTIFLGRPAYTSPAPALLSYKTGSPVIFAETIRTNAHYTINYKAPIWPDREKPLENEVQRIMSSLLSQLEESIRHNPAQWLWTHNRWKQQTLKTIKGRFRYDAILIILPLDPLQCEKYISALATFREIYKSETLFVFVSNEFASRVNADEFWVLPYSKESDLFLKDYRFKCIFNFSSCSKVKKHYLKLATFEVFSIEDLRKLSKTNPEDLNKLLKESICRAR